MFYFYFKLLFWSCSWGKKAFLEIKKLFEHSFDTPCFSGCQFQVFQALHIHSKPYVRKQWNLWETAHVRVHVQRQSLLYRRLEELCRTFKHHNAHSFHVLPHTIKNKQWWLWARMLRTRKEVSHHNKFPVEYPEASWASVSCHSAVGSRSGEPQHAIV